MATAKIAVKPLLLVAVSLLISQMLYISLRFDAHTLLSSEALDTWRVAFSPLGSIPKLVIIAAAVFLILKTFQPKKIGVQNFNGQKLSRFYKYIAFQIVAFGVFVYSTTVLFSKLERNEDVSVFFLIFWVLLALTVFYALLLSIAGTKKIFEFVRHEKINLLVTLVTTGLLFFCSLYSQSLWNGLAQYTFKLTSYFLAGYDKSIVTNDPENKIIGLGDFVVEIAPVCSGYEGIGLVTGFSMLYLFINRKDLRFPEALALIPIGAFIIWLLNSFRIAALIVIGHHISPSVAISGFHSHAGWITFIMTSILIIFLVNRTKIIRVEKYKEIEIKDGFLPEKTLFPFIGLMASILVIAAVSQDFDYLYPAKVIIVGFLIWRIWPSVHIGSYSSGGLTIAGSLLIALTWIIMVSPDSSQNEIFDVGLASMSSTTSFIWLSFRFVGSVVTVPIAEELVFRGYLLSRLSRSEVKLDGDIQVKVGAIIGSSVIFGALHASIYAGFIAGIILCFVRLKSGRIGDAIICHSLANALIFLYAVYSGNPSIM